MAIVYLEQYLMESEGKEGFLIGYSSYKQLLREAISDISFNDLYKDWISESKETTLEELKEYEQRKKYNANIVDIIIVALATISKASIVAYYIDKETVKNYIFKSSIGDSKTIIELAFINGHYDLIVDKETLTLNTEEGKFANSGLHFKSFTIFTPGEIEYSTI